MKKNIGQHREFLNMPAMVSMTSCISYKIGIESWDPELLKEGLCDQADIQFAMSDCREVIRLDFTIQDKENMRNSLHKLDVIINACTKMKQDIKIARKEILIGQKRKKELDLQKENKK